MLPFIPDCTLQSFNIPEIGAFIEVYTLLLIILNLFLLYLQLQITFELANQIAKC